MSRVIVTTTINPPTEALRRFAALPDWSLVVIGDKKTPSDFHIDGAIYVPPEEQERYDPDLSEALGWNCVERRNYGFLWARDMGAEVVAVVDDDNIPLDGWGENVFVGREVEVDYYETDLGSHPNCSRSATSERRGARWFVPTSRRTSGTATRTSMRSVGCSSCPT